MRGSKMPPSPVTSAVQSIESAKLRLGSMAELASEDLRKSLINIEELAGRSDMEQVFDSPVSALANKHNPAFSR